MNELAEYEDMKRCFFIVNFGGLEVAFLCNCHPVNVEVSSAKCKSKRLAQKTSEKTRESRDRVLTSYELAASCYRAL